MSQDSPSRELGSHTSTRPQSHVLPSSPRSYHRPPTRGSMMASTAFALLILYTANGHQVPICSVKTCHATSREACTFTTLRTLFGSVQFNTICSAITISLPSLPPAQPLP